MSECESDDVLSEYTLSTTSSSSASATSFVPVPKSVSAAPITMEHSNGMLHDSDHGSLPLSQSVPSLVTLDSPIGLSSSSSSNDLVSALANSSSNNFLDLFNDTPHSNASAHQHLPPHHQHGVHHHHHSHHHGPHTHHLPSTAASRVPISSSFNFSPSPSPTDWPRAGSTAIPIGPSGGRPRASSQAGSNQPIASSPATSFLAGLGTSPVTTTPPLTPTLAALAGTGGRGSFTLTHITPPSSLSSVVTGPVVTAKPTHTPTSASGSTPSSSSGRSWSLIEHGRRFFNGGSKKETKATKSDASQPSTSSTAASSSVPIPISGARGANGSAPHPKAGVASSVGSDSDSEPNITSTSWSGGGVTHIPLPANLTDNRGRGRSQSFAAPPSSALTAHIQAQQAAAAASPLKVFLNSREMPSAAKSNLGRVLEYNRDLERCIDEYKSSLSKLWSRKRQVLGTLNASQRRLQAWMQYNKMAVLVELIQAQEELFDREENMLRAACVLLKERQASMKATQDIMHETVERLAVMITVHGSDSKALQQASHDLLVTFPPKELMDYLTPTPKAWAQAHPILSAHATEHRSLSARLEACKTKYLAAARQTEVEELQPRVQRYKKAVSEMVAAQCALQAQAQASNPNASPTSTPNPSTTPLPTTPGNVNASSAAPSSLPPVLFANPHREAESLFARLMLDERSKEGKTCAEFIARFEAIVQEKASHTPQPRSVNIQPIDETSTEAATADSLSSHAVNQLTKSVSEETGTSNNARGGLGKSTSTASLQGLENELSFELNGHHIDYSASNSQTPSSSVPVSPAAHTSATAGFLNFPPAPQSALSIHTHAYELLTAYLLRVEPFLMKENSFNATLKPCVRLLIQRTLFPRIWKSMLALGYESQDLNGLPPLPPVGHNDFSLITATDDVKTAVTPSPSKREVDGESRSDEAVDMNRRENILQSQIRWIRRISPKELGVPDVFLKPIVPASNSTLNSPSAHTSSRTSLITATPSPTSSGSATTPPNRTSTPGRAPPTHKPALPPNAATPSPSSANAAAAAFLASLPSTPPLAAPFRKVVDELDEISMLVSPADMLSSLLSACKLIYVAARQATDARREEQKKRGETLSKQEALGADSFFPLFLSILVQSSVSNWLLRMKLMQMYGLNEDGENLAEAGYYLTTLEAALLFLQQATPTTINPNQTPKRRGSRTDECEVTPKKTEPKSTPISDNIAAADAKVAVPAISIPLSDNLEPGASLPPSNQSVDISPEVVIASAPSATPLKVNSNNVTDSVTTTPTIPKPILPPPTPTEPEILVAKSHSLFGTQGYSPAMVFDENDL